MSDNQNIDKEKEMPQVSIIMPCHNGAAYIKDAICSVQNQTFTDWELLVVDDNSTDASVEIVKELSANDNRIKLFHTEKSSGLPATPRNVGIKVACGRYIAFLDCDDEWLPTKLEHQLPLFATRKVAVIFSYYSKMGENGDFWNSVIKSPTVVNFYKMLKGDCIGNLTGVYDTEKCGKVYQKEIHHEDYLMWLEILKKGFVALNTNTYEAFYRISQNSVSVNKFKTMQWHWHILRYELHLPLFIALKNFTFYAINGLLKKLKKDSSVKKL